MATIDGFCINPEKPIAHENETIFGCLYYIFPLYIYSDKHFKFRINLELPPHTVFKYTKFTN